MKNTNLKKKVLNILHVFFMVSFKMKGLTIIINSLL
jgi:hypothetical protein